MGENRTEMKMYCTWQQTPQLPVPDDTVVVYSASLQVESLCPTLQGRLFFKCIFEDRGMDVS